MVDYMGRLDLRDVLFQAGAGGIHRGSDLVPAKSLVGDLFFLCPSNSLSISLKVAFANTNMTAISPRIAKGFPTHKVTS